jgi:NADH-quinone oxidoreductase subunit A
MSILNLKTSYFSTFNQEYGILLAVLVSIIAVVLVTASYILAEQKADAEKVSIYECGFDPFEDARQVFEIKFYLVGILFILFDLEIIYLFPWAVSLNTYIAFASMGIFLAILVVGFAYEMAKGALDW